MGFDDLTAFFFLPLNFTIKWRVRSVGYVTESAAFGVCFVRRRGQAIHTIHSILYTGVFDRVFEAALAFGGELSASYRTYPSWKIYNGGYLPHSCQIAFSSMMKAYSSWDDLKLVRSIYRVPPTEEHTHHGQYTMVDIYLTAVGLCFPQWPRHILHEMT